MQNPTLANVGNPAPILTPEAVRHATSTLQAAAVDSARQVGDAASRDAAHLSGVAKDWLHRNANSARDVAAAARERAEALNGRTQQYVRDDPVKAILLAAAAGAAITALYMLLTRNDR
ncbi:MAG: hypothetical protein H7Z19_06835 [Chitinophagaceae bacterium]|nr:hypothetical protein [Rubrivivax sp.]